MPYSSQNGKAATTRFLHLLHRNNPIKSFLDVGAGSGTYVDLYRKQFPGAKWDAVEVWEPYIERFNLKQKYDQIFLKDIRQLVDDDDFRANRWDVVFLGDILEHMTKEEAIDVVNKFRVRAGVIIISMPIVHYPQDEWEGNPYEKHVKDDWSPNEAIAAFNPTAFTLHDDIGVFVVTNIFEREYCQRLLAGPRVALYGIFKNEELFIERFLSRALESFADELVLCDTGSTDKTRELIEKWRKKYHVTDWLKIYDINVMPWRFDEARNTALSFVSPYVDVCISIDIDEYVHDRFVFAVRDAWTKNPKLTRLIHGFKTYWDEADESNYSEHYHERVHARKGYKWSLPVHEILEKFDGEQVIEWNSEIVMYQRPDKNKERSSYFDLLKQSVRERPDVWKSFSFLAGEYSWRGDLHNAVLCIQKAMDHPDADKAYLKYQHASFISGTSDAIMLLSAAAFESKTREMHMYLADEWFKQGDALQAYSALITAKKFTEPTKGYMYNPAAWDHRFDAKFAQYATAASGETK